MGYVYIFENEWLPRLVKIGITDDIAQRLKDSAGNEFVPCAFRCYYAIKSDINDKLEKFIHKTYDMFRVNGKREFFEINPDIAKTMLQGLVEIGAANEVDANTTDQISQQVNKDLTSDGTQNVIKRRPRTTFEMIDVPIGSELTFKNDNSVICRTIDDTNKVEYNGEIYAISTLSDKLQGYPTSGFEYFLYEGKLLADIRREKESD